MRANHSVLLRSLTVALTAAILAGCNGLLDVTNPGAITEDDLKNPDMIPAIVNGAVGEFQPAFGAAVVNGGIFSDELISLFTTPSAVDLRRISPTSVPIYTQLQRSRGAADRGITEIEAILGDTASHNIGIARLYDYGGYSILLLAETFCAAPIDMSAAYSPNELFDMAIQRFSSAIPAAAAAKAAGASAASADSLTNLANLGIARAALGKNDLTTAKAKAALVPDDFEFWVKHSSNSDREFNNLGDANRPGHEYLGYDPAFVGLDDPRIPQDTVQMQVAFNTAFSIWLPYQPSQYDGYQPATLIRIDNATSVRFASGLEARYIEAEADGPTPATNDFVNERRAAGNEGPVTLSGDALMSELREQRRRDFMLTAHRVGDLRRYLAYHDVDQFPTGIWPGDNTLVYGTDTCMPIPNSERDSNPNVD
jgi:hypothetical protein